MVVTPGPRFWPEKAARRRGMRAPGLTLWAAAAVLRASWAWSSVKVSGRAAKAVVAAARRAAFSGLDWSLARQSASMGKSARKK